MPRWYSKNLGDALLAHEQLDLIKEAFARAVAESAQADGPIFYRHESEGRLHCEVVAYFSPAATQLAEALGATPCNKPERNGLELLAGTETAWRMLFPDAC